jgi:hypothetical protein
MDFESVQTPVRKIDRFVVGGTCRGVFRRLEKGFEGRAASRGFARSAWPARPQSRSSGPRISAHRVPRSVDGSVSAVSALSADMEPRDKARG